mmetsp:Transcript_133333/g.345057  ORF Transcript_133333/g.345057 Transcript_133333/m.345057 type:complete len:211 (-) Transcript_133333:850-1482(-)
MLLQPLELFHGSVRNFHISCGGSSSQRGRMCKCQCAVGRQPQRDVPWNVVVRTRRPFHVVNHGCVHLNHFLLPTESPRTDEALWPQPRSNASEVGTPGQEQRGETGRKRRELGAGARGWKEVQAFQGVDLHYLESSNYPVLSSCTTRGAHIEVDPGGAYDMYRCHRHAIAGCCGVGRIQEGCTPAGLHRTGCGHQGQRRGNTEREAKKQH